MRKIIHVDMDAFYASVEQRDRPELRGVPVIVGGNPDGRGVVASASYAARKFGVRSAMPAAQAKRLCPAAVFVRPDHAKYSAVSRDIRAIFHSVTDLVEPLSLDEAYLDVTVNKLGEPLARVIARHIKDRIQRELGLTASAGVGPNKFVAKIASDLRKPDGLVVVPPERVMEFVDRLPVERFWGVGPATARRLHEAGLRTAKDIRNCNLETLESAVGRKFGEFLYELSHGKDTREVDPSSDPKSRGTETTLARDVTNIDQLLAILTEQADEIEQDLRKIDRLARTVTLKVRYRDFRTITRSRTLDVPFNEASAVARVAHELLLTSTDAGRDPVRLIGISVGSLLGRGDSWQLSLGPPITG